MTMFYTSSISAFRDDALQFSMDFLSWNDLIAAHFFQPEMAGRRVYLFVTEDVLREVGGAEAAVSDFISAVKAGPPNVTRQGLCQRALQIMEGWRAKTFPFPPYIGYLALFVLAAGKEGDFAPHAYYPKLRSLLGEEPKLGQYPSFDEMVRLWDDLEQWSNKDQDGKLGIFYNNSIAGNWFHVGIPIAQTFLTERERAALPVIFARAGIDPSIPPSDEELAALVRRLGPGELRPRTLSLLARNKNEEDLRTVLIETINEELRDWDGVTSRSREQDRESFLNGALRLCCQYDEVAGTTNFTFRVSSKHELPIDGLSLENPSHELRFVTEEYGPGWSAPLVVEGKRTFVDPTHFDWSVDLVFEDPQTKWIIRSPGSPVRIFVTGEPHGINGLVEVRRLPSLTSFYLATQAKVFTEIAEWGKAHCERFRQLNVQGLPDGWVFSAADLAYRDTGIKERFPMLSLPIATLLSFRGGVRVSRRNEFLSFAPPKVILEGKRDSVDVYCNNVRLDYLIDEDAFSLPPDLPTGTQLVVEARHDGSAVSKLSFSLEDEFAWVVQQNTRKFDSFGSEIVNPTSSSISGAVVDGISSSFEFGQALRNRGTGPVFYVGRAPGQIVSHPAEPLPQTWSVIWKITMRRTGTVEYCGSSLSNSTPTIAATADHKKVQLWKDLIWHRRKRITEPVNPILRNLWREYQTIARDV